MMREVEDGPSIAPVSYSLTISRSQGGCKFFFALPWLGRTDKNVKNQKKNNSRNPRRKIGVARFFFVPKTGRLKFSPTCLAAQCLPPLNSNPRSATDLGGKWGKTVRVGKTGTPSADQTNSATSEKN